MECSYRSPYETRSKKKALCKTSKPVATIPTPDSDTDSVSDPESQDDSDYELESASDSSSESSDSDDSELDCQEETSEEFDTYKYRELLSEIFPSNYSKRLAKLSNTSKKLKTDCLSNKKRKISSVREITEEPTVNSQESFQDEQLDNIINEIFENASNKLVHEHSTRLKTSKKKRSNSKKFSALLEEKSSADDLSYFNEHMTVDEQEIAIIELEKIIAQGTIIKPYRLQLLDSDIPTIYKTIAIKKINSIQEIDPGAGEYYKTKQWIDTFMQIPFGKYKTLPVSLKENGAKECGIFMNNAKQHLDDAVYGMSDAKIQIMQLIGQWVSNPTAMGTAIAIKGPMGTGKTTLIKDGISKAIGRDFVLMALGGATDSSFLEGHSYTYEGSMCGKIIDSIIQCKSMNPIFFFDELDKVSDTPKGEEIIGILTHLIDVTQNSKFHDKYFSEIDFDLSRCLFIFSYNDESKINPILRDRMYRVETKGYDIKEKIVIANQYLLPKIREQVWFDEGDILINDDAMKYIITERTEKEQGIRNLKRCLEIIFTKANLYRLMKPDNDLFEKDSLINFSLPLTVTRDIIDKLIIVQKNTSNWSSMYL